MTNSEIISIGAFVLAALALVWNLVRTKAAIDRADRANELAEGANCRSDEAICTAKEANQIARQALESADEKLAVEIRPELVACYGLMREYEGRGQVAVLKNRGPGLARNIRLTVEINSDAVGMMGSRASKLEKYVDDIMCAWGLGDRSLGSDEEQLLLVRKEVLSCTTISARYEDGAGNLYEHPNIVEVT